ncbi:MAG TPA: GTP 3',8-cyclase MoaA [Myxococcales bacterium]|jgi:cyclic pyranopterin phosphate synthase|nr:GTP 3',8-cyclase MoaA [Myxococcales bacterium]
MLPALAHSPGADPLRAPLFDAQGRLMTYLRMSVTDRCNFRCAYCSPAHWAGKKDHLSPAELQRIAQVFARMGVRRVRLTGGEPLIRPDILEIVQRLRAVEGLEQVTMTTNASRLQALAAPLRAAGMDQLNISLDTLSPEAFRRISPMGELADVLAGIDAAVEAGFPQLKLNVVVMKGVNDGEVPALVAYAHARRIIPRFIELMPFGQGEGIPTQALIERLMASGMPMVADDAPQGPHSGPARYYRTPTGHVGFVSPMTQNFCSGCNRVRVAANGDLRSCLGGREQSPLHVLIRGGATDERLAVAIRGSLGLKPDGHRFTEAGAHDQLLPMMGIGG